MSMPLQMRKSQWTSIRTQVLKWYVNKTILKHLSMQRCHIMLITRETNVRFVIALLWSKIQNILWHIVQKHFRCWMSCNWDHCVWSGITKKWSIQKLSFLFLFERSCICWDGPYLSPPPPCPLKHLFFSWQGKAPPSGFIEMRAHTEQNQQIWCIPWAWCFPVPENTVTSQHIMHKARTSPPCP